MGLVQSKISSAFSYRAPEELVQRLPDENKEHVFDAIRAADANRLSSLIDEGAVDLTAINEETGGTALHLAISEKNDDILKMLLDVAGDNPVY